MTVNLRRVLAPLRTREYGDLIASIEVSRAKLGFKLLGYVVMPDHWHALVATASPLTISRALQDVKWLAARAVNRGRATKGAVWQRQFWDRFVRHRKEFEHRLAANGIGKSVLLVQLSPQAQYTYNARAVPQLILVGPDGHVQWSHVGELVPGDVSSALSLIKHD